MLRESRTAAALAPDRVELVNEDDARSVLPRLLEEVPHPRLGANNPRWLEPFVAQGSHFTTNRGD